jgi:molybdenum cofactor cytidylyltransferase
MGKPKQLLRYNGSTLLKNVIQKALHSNAGTAMVVLGANADLIKKEIEKENIGIVINHEWKEGMASSMIKGLDALLTTNPLIDAAIFMTCDQPFVSESLLNDLIATQHATAQPIVTCNYGNTFGPPTLFHKSIFASLHELEGDAGAKRIIQEHPNEVATVYFPKGNIDIDTVADYELLLGKDL